MSRPFARATCPICPRACSLASGQVGACRARVNEQGSVVGLSYGKLTAVALDPIEKKPLSRFMPGSTVLSVGSFGCNLYCPFCQNHDIAQVGADQVPWRYVDPEELVEQALALRDRGCIGIAFTYNEPFTFFEYMRDASLLAHQQGLKTVVVTNGMASPDVFDEALAWTDAMNIDLKAFSADGYRSCGFDGFEVVKRNIARAVATESCHVEVTSLMVPGMFTREDMQEASAWLASLDPGIPYHVTQYHPAYRMSEPALSDAEVRAYAQLARASLDDVLEGNMRP